MTKPFLKAPALFFESILDRMVSVIGALIFMQIPAFLVQYQQRLGGHVDELGRLIKKYGMAAAENGRTVEEYIGLHLNSGVKEFISTGKLMSENLARFNDISEALKNLSQSKSIVKLYVFLRDIEYDIFRGTLKNFVPGISFSIETILYAVAGIIFFMTFYFIVKKSLLFIIKKIKIKK
jgi:hypothetical protein